MSASRFVHPELSNWNPISGVDVSGALRPDGQNRRGSKMKSQRAKSRFAWRRFALVDCEQQRVGRRSWSVSALHAAAGAGSALRSAGHLGRRLRRRQRRLRLVEFEFHRAEGGFGGGQIGYNWQRDRFVFGVEGDFQGADIGGTRIRSIWRRRRDRDVNWFSTVRGRLGFASGPLLVYGTGGVAFADIDNRIHFTDGNVSRNSGTQTGYAVGGGVEWAFAPNWSAKAEYLYLGFGDDTLPSGDRINNDFQTVRVGLNYKFH